MSKSTLVTIFWLGSALALLIPGDLGAGTGGLRVEHQSAPCAVAGRPLRISSRVIPSEDVSSVRVVFRREGTPYWYAVEMRRSGDEWVGALPRPSADAARFSYFIEASSPNGRGRAPEASAFIVDVGAACSDAHLPEAAAGPDALGVPLGAPRVPAGFDTRDVGAWLELDASQPAPPVSAHTLPGWGTPRGSRVRLTTVPPPRARSKQSGEDGDTVTMAGPQQTPITLVREGRTLEGRLEAIEDGVIVLARGSERVRIREADVASLDVRRPGSPAMGTVGGLAGAAAGCLVSVLVCASADVCDSVAPVWIGTALGSIAGAAAGGAPSWKPLALVSTRNGAVALTLQPQRAGGALGIRVAF